MLGDLSCEICEWDYFNGLYKEVLYIHPCVDFAMFSFVINMSAWYKEVTYFMNFVYILV